MSLASPQWAARSHMDSHQRSSQPMVMVTSREPVTGLGQLDLAGRESLEKLIPPLCLKQGDQLVGWGEAETFSGKR